LLNKDKCLLLRYGANGASDEEGLHDKDNGLGGEGGK